MQTTETRRCPECGRALDEYGDCDHGAAWADGAGTGAHVEQPLAGGALQRVDMPRNYEAEYKAALKAHEARGTYETLEALILAFGLWSASSAESRHIDKFRDAAL